MCFFPYLEPVCCSMFSSNCCFLTCIQILKRQVRWSGIPISFRIFHSLLWSTQSKDFPDGSDSKVSVCNARDPGSIPGSGRSPGEGKGNPLRYYCLENPMDRGAWEATVHGVTKSLTWETNTLFNLEEVHWSMSSSNCFFLTCMQVSQEAGQVVFPSV